MEISEFYKKIEADYEGTLSRFMKNESMMARFVKRFPEDHTYAELLQSIEARDYGEIQARAHTLKGIASNLGFGLLAAASGELTVAMRAEEYEKTDILFEVVQKNYEKVMTEIQNLD